jgi:hypothetical protein
MNKVVEFLKKIPANKIILVGYAVAILIIFVLYVPWGYLDRNDQPATFSGYYPLWAPDNEFLAIDWQRIIAEFIAVTIIAGISFYLSKGKKES